MVNLVEALMVVHVKACSVPTIGVVPVHSVSVDIFYIVGHCVDVKFGISIKMNAESMEVIALLKDLTFL
jgi:hypothetical protein